MERRDFFRWMGGGALAALMPTLSRAADVTGAPYRRLLILVELKGGNDGLNTIVPYADPAYYALRPRIGIKRDEVVQLSERAGLHPSLAPLLPVWKAGELAIVEGVGYPAPNLSHFRSIEIWDTASRSDQYLDDGWLARAFARVPAPAGFSADGVVIGANDIGPFQGGNRVIALANIDQFVRQAHLAVAGGEARNPALEHILQVETDTVAAAARLSRGLASEQAFKTVFPQGAFGNAVRNACEVVATGGGVAALRLSLAGFDTHQNQPGTQANLLGQLADGLVSLRSALMEVDRWNDTLVLTYAEFGRRPKENASNGTDHGTASVHFALGGGVKGGFYGAPPDLGSLDGAGNPLFAVDFRSLYATTLDRWWGVPSSPVLGGHFAPVELLKT